MKKPVIIRVAGWFVWVSLALVAIGYMGGPGKAGSLLIGIGGLGFLWFAVPCFMFWAVGTGIYQLMKASAAQRARQTAPILRGRQPEPARPSPLRRVQTGPLNLGAAAGAADRPAPEPPPVNPLLTKEPCEVCGVNRRGWLLHCCRHEMNVCGDCMTTHDAPLECYYIPAGRVPRPAAEKVPNAG